MSTLEVFFDYACPFCFRGHEILTQLIPQYPNINIEWHPCEAHPRPDRYGLHSDLCACGMFYAQEQGVDLAAYHHKMFHGAMDESVNIEDPAVVSKLAGELMDGKQFYEALVKGQFVDRLLENNRLAWEAYQFPAVPSYRMDGKLLKAIGNVGITKQRLVEFLDGVTLTR